MTRIKLLAATARLSVIIATSVLAQVIQGHCAYAFYHANGNAGIESTPMRARDVTGISRETSGRSGAASASCAMAGKRNCNQIVVSGGRPLPAACGRYSFNKFRVNRSAVFRPRRRDRRPQDPRRPPGLLMPVEQRAPISGALLKMVR